MKLFNSILNEIFSKQKSGVKIFKNPQFNSKFENELLFFCKPDCFLDKNKKDFLKIAKMIDDKFREYEVYPSGGILYSGKALAEHNIMNRHYGFINKLSLHASEIITKEEKDIMCKTLNVSEKDVSFLGGHEFLKKYPQFDDLSIKPFWLAKESYKLRSGFYYQLYSVNNDEVVLINGFHPPQLKHYTAPDRQILLMILHTNTDWEKVKNEMTGNTFPEKSSPNSIRGKLFFNPDEYKTHSMNVSNNYVHMSAGPFEALYEINNFFAPIDELDFKITDTNIGLRLEKNVPLLEKILENPILDLKEPEDLFTFTENMNTSIALESIQKID